MKAVFLSFVCATLFALAPVAKAEATDHQVSPAPSGPVTSMEDILAEVDADPDHHHGIWHCTAYPHGHHHHHGFSHFDRHYEHAYHGAVHRCEAATGHHCHDVHCHQDHH